MRRDEDALKPLDPMRGEMILGESDVRRSRRVGVPMVRVGSKRGGARIKMVDTYERERLVLAAQGTHGDVTPRPADAHQVGDVIRSGGRRWVVGATCRHCGVVRLDPILLESETTLGAPRRLVECPHLVPATSAPRPVPMGPTVGVVYGENKSVLAWECATSLREQYVARVLARSAECEAAGNPSGARLALAVAMRADAMTDEEWLIDRKRLRAS